MQNNWLWLGVGILIAAILVGGLFFVSRRESPAASPAGVATSTAGTTTVDLGNGESVTLPPGATVSEVPASSGAQAPSLNQTVSYSPTLSPSVVATLKADIASTSAYLKVTPTDDSQWLQLALYYKIAGDYTAAANVWVYVAQLGGPNTNYIAYGDLGDLYMNFVQNYPKAEADYQAAIALSPHTIDYYSDLFTLYRSFYKQNTSAAADIIAQGLKANPGNSELLALQAQLQSGQ